TLVTMSSAEVKTPRLMSRRLRMEKKSSINRPSGVVSSIGSEILGNLQATEVALDAGDDTGVAGHLGVPTPSLGILAEHGDIGELGFEFGDKLWRRHEVVALLADVGVGTSLGDEVAGAVAVRNPGLEHFRA